jgi:hypothetical protein
MGYYTSKQAGKAAFSDLPKPEINANNQGYLCQPFHYSLSFGLVSDS